MNNPDTYSLHHELETLAEIGDLDKIIHLINTYPDISFSLEYPLIYANTHGHLHLIQYFIQNHLALFTNNLTELLNESLISSCMHGYLDIAKYCFDNGANIHIKNNEPLFCAVINGHADIVTFLIAQGANLYSRGNQLIVLPTRFGHLEVFKILEHHGLDIRIEEDSPLMAAASHNQLDIIHYLISKGINIHTQNDEIIKNAVSGAHLSIVQYLILEHNFKPEMALTEAYECIANTFSSKLKQQYQDIIDWCEQCIKTKDLNDKLNHHLLPIDNINQKRKKI